MAIGEKCVTIDSDIDVLFFSAVLNFLGVGSFPLLQSKENDEVS